MCTERKATGEYVLACFMFATMIFLYNMCHPGLKEVFEKFADGGWTKEPIVRIWYMVCYILSPMRLQLCALEAPQSLKVIW